MEKDLFGNPVVLPPYHFEQPRFVPPNPPVLRHSLDGALLARYQRGDHAAVWRDIQALGPLGGDLREEVLAVARSTMQRVARNVDMLAERLAARGWQPLFGAFHPLPQAEDAKVIAEIEHMTGARIPVVLEAFWGVVGGACFIWDYNAGPMPELGLGVDLVDLDPLSFAEPEAMEMSLEQWKYRNEDQGVGGPYYVHIAPDRLTKASISGCEYLVELPVWHADPVIEGDTCGLALTDYLRDAFAWGGFPGLGRIGAAPEIALYVKEFAAGLEPF